MMSAAAQREDRSLRMEEPRGFDRAKRLKSGVRRPSYQLGRGPASDISQEILRPSGSRAVANPGQDFRPTHKLLKLLAGGPGFEPRLTKSESALDDEPLSLGRSRQTGDLGETERGLILGKAAPRLEGLTPRHLPDLARHRRRAGL